MGKQTSLVPALSVEQHSLEIKNAMSRSIEGFILVGQKVLEARGQLEDNEFGTLFQKDSPNYVGMAERQGYRFLSIAKGSKKLLKFQDNLPSDVTQLDAISRMNEKEIKEAIKADVMSPSMNRGDLSKWEKSLQAQEIDPDQVSLDYTNDNEVIDIESAPVQNEEDMEQSVLERKASFLEAVDNILEFAEDKPKLQIKLITQLRKTWGLSITDLT